MSQENNKRDEAIKAAKAVFWKLGQKATKTAVELKKTIDKKIDQVVKDYEDANSSKPSESSDKDGNE